MYAFILSLLLAVLPPCADESSSNCSWDASQQGNGYGLSFVDVGGSAYYLDE